MSDLVPRLRKAAASENDADRRELFARAAAALEAGQVLIDDWSASLKAANKMLYDAGIDHVPEDTSVCERLGMIRERWLGHVARLVKYELAEMKAKQD